MSQSTTLCTWAWMFTRTASTSPWPKPRERSRCGIWLPLLEASSR